MKRRAFIKLSAASTAALAVAGYSNTYFASEKNIQSLSLIAIQEFFQHGITD